MRTRMMGLHSGICSAKQPVVMGGRLRKKGEEGESVEMLR